MTRVSASDRNLSYCKVGIDRKVRERSRSSIRSRIAASSRSYSFGPVIQLPFGTLFPSPERPETYFDLQLEGVGTKTLLAELAGNYSTIGRDAVAMAVNDVVRSGASPVLLSDAIHIAKTDPEKVDELVSSVAAGAKEAGCVLASGETGDVADLLHPPIGREAPPFDLFVSCMGTVTRSKIIRGKVSPGDRILGLPSSGIHSNGLSLARRVLLKPWGGKFYPTDVPDNWDHSILEELLVPTKIYAMDLETISQKVAVKAAVHITGDGFSKFHRLLDWPENNQRVGFAFALDKQPPPIFELIEKMAKAMNHPITMKEMYRTFNMGYGFALVVSEEDAEEAIAVLKRKSMVEDIGFVSEAGKVALKAPGLEKPILL